MKPVEFDTNAFEDLAWWIQQDRKTALRTGINLSRDRLTVPGIGLL